MYSFSYFISSWYETISFRYYILLFIGIVFLFLFAAYFSLSHEVVVRIFCTLLLGFLVSPFIVKKIKESLLKKQEAYLLYRKWIPSKDLWLNVLKTRPLPQNILILEMYYLLKENIFLKEGPSCEEFEIMLIGNSSSSFLKDLSELVQQGFVEIIDPYSATYGITRQGQGYLARVGEEVEVFRKIIHS